MPERKEWIRWVKHEKAVEIKVLASALCLSVVGGVAIGASLTANQSFASNSPIPNLIGIWKVNTEGATVLHGENYSTKSHHTNQFTTLTAEAVIHKQEGRRVIGVFKSPRYSEKFAGVISVDGKSFAYVDEDGSLDGKIINNNLIEVVYRHISPTESVVASGTYTRK